MTEIKKQGLLLFFDVISKLQEVLFSAEPVVLDNNIVNSHYPEMPPRTAAQCLVSILSFLGLRTHRTTSVSTSVFSLSLTNIDFGLHII